jgi:hypothetical protein
MKNAKLLLALIVILLAYGVLLTLHSIGMGRRLSQLEASHKELEWRYRIDSNILARVKVTPELLKIVRAVGAEAASRLPRTNLDLRPLGGELNSPPEAVSSR